MPCRTRQRLFAPRRTRLDRNASALTVLFTVGGCGAEIVPDADPTDASTSAGASTSSPLPGTVSSATSADATSAGGDDTASTRASSDDDPSASDNSSNSSAGGSDGVGCRADADCPGSDAPFCDRGACVPCSETAAPDDACASRDPRTPACIDSACAPCPGADALCPAPAAACVCQACTQHTECPRNAGCDISSGDCLPFNAVFWVSDVGPCPGDGTRGAPFCAIQDAVDAIAPSGAGTIHIGPSAGVGYGQDVLVDGDRTIALLGPEAGPAILTPAVGGAPSILTIAGAGTTVYLDRLRLRTSAEGPAIAIEASTVRGDRLEVVQNSGGGIVLAEGAELELVNAMVGSGYDYTTSISISESDATISGSTIIGGAGAPAVACTAPGAVDIRGSIVLSSSSGFISAVDCAGATLSGSATEAEAGAYGFGSTWFQNSPGGDYHLAPSGDAVFAGLGVWQDGDPLHDIDGDARSGMAGSADYPGADVP